MIRVKILKPILAGEMAGQIRLMSPEVAHVRQDCGTVEIVPEEPETPESREAPVETSMATAPVRRRRINTRAS